MKCSVCKINIGTECIILNCDGDVACSISCEEKYKLDRDMFFNNMRNPEYNFFESVNYDN